MNNTCFKLLFVISFENHARFSCTIMLIKIQVQLSSAVQYHYGDLKLDTQIDVIIALILNLVNEGSLRAI